MPNWVLFLRTKENKTLTPTDFLYTGDGVPGPVMMGWGWGIGTGRLWVVQMKRRTQGKPSPVLWTLSARTILSASPLMKNRQETELDSRGPKRPVVAQICLCPAVKVADLPNLGAFLTVLRYPQEVSDVGVAEKCQG